MKIALFQDSFRWNSREKLSIKDPGKKLREKESTGERRKSSRVNEINWRDKKYFSLSNINRPKLFDFLFVDLYPQIQTSTVINVLTKGQNITFHLRPFIETCFLRYLFKMKYKKEAELTAVRYFDLFLKGKLGQYSKNSKWLPV